MSHINRTRLIYILLSPIVLSACGGGGSEGGESVASNPSVAARTSVIAAGDIDCVDTERSFEG